MKTTNQSIKSSKTQSLNLEGSLRLFEIKKLKLHSPMTII
jgi:hypothetical protein